MPGGSNQTNAAVKSCARHLDRGCHPLFCQSVEYSANSFTFVDIAVQQDPREVALKPRLLVRYSAEVLCPSLPTRAHAALPTCVQVMCWKW